MDKPESETIEIYSLGDDDYEVIKPISVVVITYQDGDPKVTATWAEPDIGGCGDTKKEALESLLVMISTTYDVLTEPNAPLGGTSPEELATMKQHIARQPKPEPASTCEI